MPKIAYIEKDFRTSSLLVINVANEIIERYDREYGINLTLRQLYYQFVSLGDEEMERLGFPTVNGSHNNEKSYDRLGSIIADARMAGLVDWNAIEDRTRSLKRLSHWTDPGDIMESVVYSFRMDKWKNQEFKPEVWIEKEALIGAISKTCNELDVPYFACKGYVSASEMWGAAQRFQRYEERGQKVILIHLGDHDPSGIDMTRDIDDRQNLFQAYGVEVERVALNMDQIDKYNPPPNPAKLTDSRCKDYIANYGRSSWELDALDPSILQRIVKSTVLKYRDEEKYAEVYEQESRYREILRNVQENWETLDVE